MVTRKALLIFNRNDVEGLRYIWVKIPFILFDEVMVIDGNSVDGSYEFVVGNGVRCHQQNRMGRGNALQEAMQMVTGDVIVELSSDGNEDPRYIPALLHQIESGADLAIASRFAKGGRSDDDDDPVRIRKFGNKLFTSLVNLFWGSALTDATNGLRAFRLSAWRRMNLHAAHFEAEFLMSIRAAKLKLKIAEIPTVEGRRRSGKAQARTSRVGYSLLRVVFQELFNGRHFERAT